MQWVTAYERANAIGGFPIRAEDNLDPRPAGLTDQTTLQTTVSGVTYGPAGEILTINYGGVNETRTYNNLLQLTALSAFHFGRQYRYSGTAYKCKFHSQTDASTCELVSFIFYYLNGLI
ncbi:MAG: hypothetical protein ACRD9L_05670, partial [Bryobacteraceae bacterium]